MINVKTKGFLERDGERIVGFTPRLFVYSALPYRDPNTNVYDRIGPDFTVRMFNDGSNGLPFGVYARLVLMYLTTRVKTDLRSLDPTIENPKVEIPSIRQFAKELGVATTGDSLKALASQLRRLKRLVVSVIYSDPTRDGGEGPSFLVLRDFWFEPWNSSEASWVELDWGFIREVGSRPLPINLEHVRLLRQRGTRGACMDLDVYCWIANKLQIMEHKNTELVEIPVDALMSQFGDFSESNRKSRYKFRKVFGDSLLRVSDVYRHGISLVQGEDGRWMVNVRYTPLPLPHKHTAA